MNILLGSTATLSLQIKDEHIRGFAQLMGDDNPVHLDDEFAARTRFGRRIAHGNLAAAMVSRLLGTKLPGPGTIYLSQSLRFHGPVFPGDVLVATVTVTKIREDKPIITLATVCSKEDGTAVLSGEATVLYEEVPNR
ncbi:MAG: MaoC family dehydratase [Nitrospirota bacterium]